MKPDEIISRLDCMLHHPRLSDICEDCDAVQETQETLTAAVQAVKLLEQIKQELRGECVVCKHFACPVSEAPCVGCAGNHSSPHWEFRWPLGEEAEHEAH